MEHPKRAGAVVTGPNGRSLVAGRELEGGAAGGFRAVDPRSGEEVSPVFGCAVREWIDLAAEAAWGAFESYGELGGPARGALLEAIAEELDAAHDRIIERGVMETGLTGARLGGEFKRMVSTLRSLARAVREGSWVRPSIDHPVEGAAQGTIPGHDIRRVVVPLGPVAVFGASNFPLAYGVAGGDTASALAAGCPVIVKGHPAHPGTGEIMARAVVRAVERIGVDAGVFSYMHAGGEGEMGVGRALVEHPRVAAVGFTGSFKGGMALAAIAAGRERPIPVFAEMGSTNPVYVLPGAAAERGAAIGETLASSILESSGQQCTCPGIIFVVDGAPGVGELTAALASRLEAARENVMLTRRVRDGYRGRVAACIEVEGVGCSASLRGFARGPVAATGPVVAPAGVMETTLGVLLGSGVLREEVFGPAALVVRCAGVEEMRAAVGGMPGSLTASVFAGAAETALARRMLPWLFRGAGRVIYNGVPTGVRVAPSMVHAGPFPATNRPEATAVGPMAMERWVRPVCLQNLPETLFPDVVAGSNPLRVRRMVDGEWSGV